MPRRVEDIVPNDRRTVRDTAPTKRQVAPEKERSIPIHRLKIAQPERPTARVRKHRTLKIGWKWPVSVLVVLVVVAISGYAASTGFSRATFKIAPVVMTVQADTTFVATATTTPGYLLYRTSRFADAASTVVPAVDGAITSTKSFGRITLYNAYAAQPQRLLAGTRIWSGSGLIYRLTGSVVIPGYSGAAMTPGTVSATIVADQPGSQYNITKNDSPGKWYMVAYMGGPRYSTVYATLASDISGGFLGQKKTIDPTILASTAAMLQKALTVELLAEAKASVSDGYILYDNAYGTSFIQPVLSGSTTGQATITVSGSLTAAELKTSDLVSKLAGADKVAAFGSFPYTTQGLTSLSFNIVNQADFSPAKSTTMIVRAKGPLKLIGTVPVEALRDKLLGLSLADTRTVMESYGAVIDVTRSSGEIFPSWTTSVPRDKGRVTVTLLTE